MDGRAKRINIYAFVDLAGLVYTGPKSLFFFAADTFVTFHYSHLLRIPSSTSVRYAQRAYCAYQWAGREKDYGDIIVLVVLLALTVRTTCVRSSQLLSCPVTSTKDGCGAPLWSPRSPGNNANKVEPYGKVIRRHFGIKYACWEQ